MEWKDRHGTKNRIGMGASQTCGDSSSLLTAGVGKNSCGLSVRDVKDSSRATGWSVQIGSAGAISCTAGAIFTWAVGRFV